MSTNSVSFNNGLPVELLQEIFRSFSNRELRIIGLACKTWFHAAMSLQQRRIENIIRAALPAQQTGIQDIVAETFPRVCLSSVCSHLKNLKTGGIFPRFGNLKIKGFNVPQAQNSQEFYQSFTLAISTGDIVEIIERSDPKFIEYTRSAPKFDVVISQKQPFSFLVIKGKIIICKEELVSTIEAINSNCESPEFNTGELFSSLENIAKEIFEQPLVDTELKYRFYVLLLDLLISRNEIDVAIKIYNNHLKDVEKLDCFFYRHE